MSVASEGGVQHILDDPFIMGVVLAAALPLVIALILSGAFGRAIGPHAAGLSLVIAFIVVHLAIFGWPLFPPRSSLQKIVYLAGAGLALGLVLDRISSRLPALIWPAVIVAWLGWPRLAGMQPFDLIALLLLWLAGAFVFDRLLAVRTAGIVAPTLLLVAALGASGIAFTAYAESLSQLAAALAAAAGGYLLWNWPKLRYGFSAGAVFSATTAFFAVATSIVLFTRASLPATAILLVVFALGPLRTRIPLAGRPVLGPLVFGAVAMLPVLAAIAAAVLMATPTNS